MLDIVHFPLFVASVALLCVTPGPDLAYIIGQSMVRDDAPGSFRRPAWHWAVVRMLLPVHWD